MKVPAKPTFDFGGAKPSDEAAAGKRVLGKVSLVALKVVGAQAAARKGKGEKLPADFVAEFNQLMLPQPALQPTPAPAPPAQAPRSTLRQVDAEAEAAHLEPRFARRKPSKELSLDERARPFEKRAHGKVKSEAAAKDNGQTAATALQAETPVVVQSGHGAQATSAELRLAPAPVVLEPRLVQAVLDDPSLFVRLNPRGASMKVDVGEAGKLEVRVRIEDGVTDLRMVGAAAPQLMAREAELRVSLGEQGLSLGQFESHQQSQQPQDEAKARFESGGTGPSRQVTRPTEDTTEPAALRDGRIHVKA